MNKLEFKIIQDYCNGVSTETISRNLYLSEDFVKETIEKYKGAENNKAQRSEALLMLFMAYGIIAGWMLVTMMKFDNPFYDIIVYMSCILSSFCIFAGLNKWGKL